MKPSEIGAIQKILEGTLDPPIFLREQLAAAFKAEFGPKGQDIGIFASSIVSARDGEGKVELQVGPTIVQMDLPKARVVLGFLAGAIQAAVSDVIFYKWLTEKLHMDRNRALAALLDLRELRQGTRTGVGDKDRN